MECDYVTATGSCCWVYDLDGHGRCSSPDGFKESSPSQGCTWATLSHLWKLSVLCLSISVSSTRESTSRNRGKALKKSKHKEPSQKFDQKGAKNSSLGENLGRE